MSARADDQHTITDADFASFLDEVAREVAAHVDPWRLRIGEAVAHWRGEGFAVDVLERALRLQSPPDVDALLGTYEQAVNRLRIVRARVAEHDASLAEHPALFDPRRLGEAEQLLPRASVVTPAKAGVHISTQSLDRENWVLEWPDVRDLLVERWP